MQGSKDSSGTIIHSGKLNWTETEMNQTNFNLINQQSQFDLISIVDSVSVDSVSV